MHAFGLTLPTARPLAGLLAGPGPGPTGSRACAVELVEPPVVDRAWAAARPTTVREDRWPDGRLFISVERDDAVGYRIHAPEHGLHLVAPDGARVLSWLPAGPAWRWQRLLFAQVLPLAATLRGLEVLHASAVALDGRAVALVAPSGTGKTSVATHLRAQGAGFVTDDALAVEAVDGGVLAHPGPRFSSVSEHELDAAGPGACERLGRPVGRSDKLHLEPGEARGPLELAGLYFLSRPVPGPFAVREAADGARLLLGSSFVAYVRTPGRLLAHLDLCAALARAVPVHRVAIPPEVDAAQVARRLAAHVRGEA